jgi:outer membrane receptor protein involved in Fe transport
MFSADELLNSGNNYVSYFGYDYTGKKESRKPSWQDFFNEVDGFGNKKRSIPAFEPIYMSGYIMDKFAFKDLIFNVGVRVDRFDANQPVLKDPWLLNAAKTVGEVDAVNEYGIAHPTNMESGYTVYVNDLNDPTAIRGYRRLNNNGTSTWFNAEGIEISDPSLLYVGGRIAPLLVDPASALEDIKPEVFTDYKPQINVMPRIAFSFPISDEALFFAHYDILTKRPTEGSRMDITDYYFIRNTNNVLNNPNLKPETTIDFELGFQQVLSKRS